MNYKLLRELYASLSLSDDIMMTMLLEFSELIVAGECGGAKKEFYVFC